MLTGYSVYIFFREMCNQILSLWFFFFFLRFYLFIRERGRREKKRERNFDVWEIHWLVASHIPSTGDLAHNPGTPGMFADRESNQQPFSSQASTQSTEPHQPGPFPCVLIRLFVFLLLSYKSSLYILPINIFSTSTNCLFTCLIMFFEEKKF